MNATDRETATLVSQVKRIFNNDSQRFSEYVLKHNVPSTLAKWTPAQLSAAIASLTSMKENSMSTATAAAAVVFLVSFKADAPSIVAVRGFASEEEAQKIAATLTGQQVFVIKSEADMDNLPGETQLAIFNRTRKTPAKQFATPEAARQASFKALPAIVSRTEDGKTPAKGEKAAKPKKEKAAAKPREKKLLQRDPAPVTKIRSVRAGTKVAILIDLLHKAGEKGVSLAKIEEALSQTGRPAHAPARLAYDLNKLVGYGYRQIENGNVVLVMPKGMTEPKGHTIKEAKPTKAQKEVQKAAATTKGKGKAAAKTAAPKEEAPKPKRRPKAEVKA